jgi:hypothetical protein
MEHSGLSASDVLAMTRDNNDGGAMGGYGFWWIIVFLIVAGMFSGGGFFGNNANTTTADALLTASAMNNAGSNRTIEDAFLQRDIFNVNQNVSNTGNLTQRDILESRYTTQLGDSALQSTIQNTACGTQKEILESRYDSALANQNLISQMQTCCCDLKTATQAQTQAILDKMCDYEIQTLRDQVNVLTNQLSNTAQNNTIISALRPTPIPAYITASPYQSYPYGYGCGYNI